MLHDPSAWLVGVSFVILCAVFGYWYAKDGGC